MKSFLLIPVFFLIASQPCFSAEKKSKQTTAPAGTNYEVRADSRTNVEKLSDPDASVRTTSARVLSRERDRKYLPDFIKLLNDKNPIARRIAVDALIEISTGPEMAAPVLALLKTEEELNVKLSCINAVSRVKYEPALKYLVTMADDQNPVIRTYSLSALGEFNSPGTYSLIEGKIKDPAEGVKIEAVKACVKLKIKTALPEIVELLKYPIAPVRREAASALGELGDKSVRKNLEKLLSDKDKSVAGAAKEALDKIAKK
ncbi:MAG: hypothetical protein A2297_01215 [Elusimicrobia bacterium RIFOXYB2_FULL_48_7]|nr:MAG: hypothetical protein A2297_01215 [Elusimicrobia bacterium RIFOXYB2_FULL_48_7]